MSVISLYTGAGGLDLGLEAAGLRVSLAVEMDAKACDTLRENRGRNWHVFQGDIHDLTSPSICERTGLAPEEPDLLVGGPPCQPFSKAAYWRSGDTKRLDDPRADTLTAYLRVLRDLRPRVFLLENVHGLMFRGKDEGLRLLRDTINAINAAEGTSYSFAVQKLNAADYGVPQTRERVFVVGERSGKVFRFPEATHRDPDANEDLLNGAAKRTPWMTAWDAIGDLADDDDPSLRVGGAWGDLLPSIPEGENYLWHTSRGGGMPLFGWRRRYWGFLLKLSKRRPAWTVQAQPGTAIGPFHWKSRRLSTRELCRIQTFPDDYQIVGGRSDVQRQIGNAVPSLMGEILGRAIRQQLLGHSTRSRAMKLGVSQRPGLPRPEPVTRVPKKYHKYAGDHAAHPGTGLGYAFAGRPRE
ncbi:MAG: DNA (cytosine-5-)-methyltransferase [Pseudomonadota bacterium]|jgi:DNA (cytosine-5)-methyltransferase 1|nr:DNA (cytosine-5-)-methyltransferase [Pseudomonadota bacterium]